MTEQEWISEEIIFDYLEGNLSVEEKDAFELLMNESEMIAHEVKVWRNTYISEPLPNVEHLENFLIIKSSSAGAGQLKRFLSAMALLLLLTSPSPNVYEFSEKESATLPVLNEAQMDSNVLKDSDCGGIPNIFNEKIGRQKSKTTDELILVSHRETVHPQVLLSKPFIWKEIQLKEIPFVETKLVTTSMVKKKMIRKSRSLNAQKRRNEVENIAAKFLSGREPYVVPLKSTNF
jgi:hypothetical protein